MILKGLLNIFETFQKNRIIYRNHIFLASTVAVSLVTSKQKERPQKSESQKLDVIFYNFRMILLCKLSQGTRNIGRIKRKNKIRGQY